MSQAFAMTFNSIAIAVGRASTATVVLAGRISEKYSAYTSLYPGKSLSISIRKTRTSTTLSRLEPYS